mmetsp:Transcript_55585/g.132942  ORF Transcript_55585/g.132942 Transcript_55585/m.132942 type:complete len:233 (+) Transcript_55585:304-1002(+)
MRWNGRGAFRPGRSGAHVQQVHGGRGNCVMHASSVQGQQVLMARCLCFHPWARRVASALQREAHVKTLARGCLPRRLPRGCLSRRSAVHREVIQVPLFGGLLAAPGSIDSLLLGNLLPHRRWHRLDVVSILTLANVLASLQKPHSRRPILRVWGHQPMDERAELGAPCHWMIGGDDILCVENRHGRGVVLKWMPVKRQGVKDAAQHPNVDQLRYPVPLSPVQLHIRHLRRPV